MMTMMMMMMMMMKNTIQTLKNVTRASMKLDIPPPPPYMLLALRGGKRGKGDKPKPKGWQKPGDRDQEEEGAKKGKKRGKGKGKQNKDSSGKPKATGKENPSSAVVIAPPPLQFLSKEELKLEIKAGGLKTFNLSGLLQLTITNLKNRNFKVKVENMGSLDAKFKPTSSFDKGVFAQKSLLQCIGGDNSFPAGQSRPLHWSLNVKDMSNVPINFNCRTFVAEEQTNVTLEYDAFDLLDLEDVNVCVPIKADKAEIRKMSNCGGSCWYDPRNAKVHWKIEAIDQSNRNGSIEFVVPGAVDVPSFFPVAVKVKATSTYTNLKLTIVPSKKHDVPPRFLHTQEFIAECNIDG